MSKKTVFIARNTVRTHQRDPADHDALIEAFHVLLQSKTIETLVLESVNNMDMRGADVYDREFQYHGKDSITEVSEEDRVFLRKRIIQLFRHQPFKNKHITPYLSEKKVMKRVVQNMIVMKDKTLLDFALTAFKQMENLNKSFDVGTLMLFKLFDPSLRFQCFGITQSEDLLKYLNELLKYHVSRNRTMYLYALVKHIQMAYECEDREQSGGAPQEVEYKIYNGRKYKVRTGKRGGRFILCGEKKVYV